MELVWMQLDRCKCSNKDDAVSTSSLEAAYVIQPIQNQLLPTACLRIPHLRLEQPSRTESPDTHRSPAPFHPARFR